jgi:CLIP-associating protein 1/2
MLRGQAYEQFSEAFVAGSKAGIMDAINKTVLSLRTTVAQQSCSLLQELAEHLGAALDPFVENLLPTLGKMAYVN